MIYTLLKAHTAVNNYDGYAPHHHLQLIKMHPGEYLSVIANKGLVYPNKEFAHLILNPYLYQWVAENINTVGYGYREKVAPEHAGLYAFGDLHDGIDGQTTPLTPSPKIATVSSYYKNANGYKATAEVFAVEEKDLLQPNEMWLKNRQGEIVKGEIIEGTGYIKTPYREAFNDKKILYNSGKKLAYWEG
ncbi:hypothetical protein EOM81_08320 [bacterium]|nr:hypothetical protein [bacterium]